MPKTCRLFTNSMGLTMANKIKIKIILARFHKVSLVMNLEKVAEVSLNNLESKKNQDPKLAYLRPALDLRWIWISIGKMTLRLKNLKQKHPSPTLLTNTFKSQLNKSSKVARINLKWKVNCNKFTKNNYRHYAAKIFPKNRKK